jgi:hypothetical protein
MPKSLARRPAPRKTARTARRLPASAVPPDYIERLKRVAALGQLFIDGDDCEAVLRPAARTWTSGDDIDYDFDVSTPLKQTIFRLERVESFVYEAVLWRRRPDDPKKAEVLLAGRKGSPYGRGPMPMFAALRQALVAGRSALGVLSRTDYLKRLNPASGHVWMADRESLLRTGLDRIVSVFVPIRNSLGETTAALELACVGRDG